jgi:GNAT superfamily N-acetyltransferase
MATGVRSLEGLSLRLTGWKRAARHRWPGRQLIAVVNRAAVGHIRFGLHPDGLALEVSFLRVSEEFRGLGLASLLMDALYQAHPDAWINHGPRSPDGAQWWDQYYDPAPERNIHNTAPREWASYFHATTVAANRARNAEWNTFYRLHGHHDAEHRYGQRLEEEFQSHDHYFISQLDTPRIDPTRQDLYAGQRLYLPPGLHRYVHNGARPAADRAQALLDHIGHGNLPRSAKDSYTGFWNISAGSAFDDALHAELFQDVPDPRPATHLVYHALPLAADPGGTPRHQSRGTYVRYTDPGDLSIDLTGMSWRSAAVPRAVHSVVLDRPVRAAVPPEHHRDASPGYGALYDELGRRRADGAAGGTPFEERTEEIRARAEKIMRDVAARSRPARPPARGFGQPPVLPPPAPSGPRPG